ncbi:alpha/beta hydrolase [Nocardia sp. NPDC052566]|uniref:alpha/beta hydrolase n=1 Tax=Nocardia sp. NPDC052566 TaxID=3364330 RepID=UPI0037C51087
MQAVELISVDGIALAVAVHVTDVLPVRGAVLLVHGITVDMDEGGGMFVRLAERLVAGGFNVVRMSFRGHGASAGSQQGVTIAGECLDLQAAVTFTRQRFIDQPFSVVAASFGAVSTALSLPWLNQGMLHRMVLWNPVLDLVRTFLEPELAWGKENFGREQRKHLEDNGFLLVDQEFQLGRVIFLEFARYRPLDDFLANPVPTLVVHGDNDSAVSYDIAVNAARNRADTTLHTVVGSDHGFDSRDREDEAITVTVDWLIEQSTPKS